MHGTRQEAAARVLAALAAACAIASFPLSAHAQGFAVFGTWDLNVAKSKYTPGPAPRANTVTYEASGDGIKVSAKGTDAEGKPTAVNITGGFDGRDYPVSGSPDYDAVVFRKTGPSTLETIRKKGGKTVQTSRYRVSSDGKTLTITATGTSARGVKINNTSVFDRR